MYSLNQFDPLKYNFIDLVRSLFGDIPLNLVHTIAEKEYKELFKVGADAISEFHKTVYDKYRAGWPEMVDLYEKFIAEVVAKDYSEDFLYQSFPTFRFALPNNVAVGAFHTDAEFGHPPFEINYIIPLTNARDTASVWVETFEGSEQYHSMVMLTDHLIQFNGNRLRHGNHINLTNFTRCSIDFRVLPIANYNPENEGESITRHTRFKEGEYYKRFNK